MNKTTKYAVVTAVIVILLASSAAYAQQPPDLQQQINALKNTVKNYAKDNNLITESKAMTLVIGEVTGNMSVVFSVIDGLKNKVQQLEENPITLTEEQVDAFVSNNGFSMGNHTINTDTVRSDAEIQALIDATPAPPLPKVNVEVISKQIVFESSSGVGIIDVKCPENTIIIGGNVLYNPNLTMDVFSESVTLGEQNSYNVKFRDEQIAVNFISPVIAQAYCLSLQ
jgi:hypothetical protein